MNELLIHPRLQLINHSRALANGEKRGIQQIHGALDGSTICGLRASECTAHESVWYDLRKPKDAKKEINCQGCRKHLGL